jgi:cell division protein FtsL
MTGKGRLAIKTVTPNKVTGIGVKNSRGRRIESRLTGRQWFLIFFLLLFLTGSGIGYVWSNFERTQLSYSLSDLKRNEIALREINKKLRLELATLKSTRHLEEVAVTKLGLKQPSPSQIVVLP